MRKFISAVSATVVFLASIPAMNVIPQVSAEDDIIKIMCIGDSITDGYTPEYVGSYRKFIYHSLTEMGYNIDMVGAKDGGWTPSYTDTETGETWEFDNENTGYSGYSVMSYSGRTGIYETLQSTDCLALTQPDIVTLQIGTNDVIDNHDIDTAGERLEILVDYILDNIPSDATLFISPIPALDPNKSDVYSWFENYRHSTDWSEQYSDEEAEMNVEISLMKYNTQVMALAEKKKQEGKNVVFSKAALEITDVKTQLSDGVHPNNVGYKAMGEKWAETIDEYLKGNPPVESATTTTTSATTSATVTTTATTSDTTTATVSETTAETSAITTVTTTATTTATATATEVTTTEPAEEDNNFKVGDLVKLTYYVLDYAPEEYTEDIVKKYDLNKDGRTDVFDVALMRNAVIGNVNKLLEKRQELGDENFLDLSGLAHVELYPDEYYETSHVPSSSSGSHNTYLGANTTIEEVETDDQTEEDIIKYFQTHNTFS